MKKSLRNLLCAGAAAITMLAMPAYASASSVSNNMQQQVNESINQPELILVSDEVVTLEDGVVAEIKTFLEDGIEPYAANKGQRKYKCEARYSYSVNPVDVIIWVEGTFHWDSEANRAWVDDDAYGHYRIVNGSFKYDKCNEEHGSDQGGLLFGKKYAYIKYTLSFLNTTGKENSYTLSFDVNVNGDTHWDTKLATNDVTVS